MAVAQSKSKTERSRGADAGWTMSVQLPRDITCAALARRMLADRVGGELSERELEDASLIISELATNAYRHGRGRIVMNVQRVADRLRLEVTDEGEPSWIDVVPERERDAAGYGLWLVSQLGSDWGIGGTACVWAELVLGPRRD
jgi:anti-sigma regulatory factor (Ser/Thr protein kinase)